MLQAASTGPRWGLSLLVGADFSRLGLASPTNYGNFFRREVARNIKITALEGKTRGLFNLEGSTKV